jgi:anion-transporting  ArsA/GET3 family ATPase
MDHPVDPLTGLPHDERIRSRKLANGVATIIVDATGLGASESKRLEDELRAAALSIGGVREARIAMTAAQQARTLIAIGSGKGGVGKSTVSAAIGMAAAGRGLRALLVEVASQERMSLLFDQGGPIGYHETPVYPGLDAFSIDPEKALEEYLVSQLKVRAVVERLVSNRAFGHVTAAAPGLRELVTLAKIRQLAERGRHDIVVVDAPATGHGLGFLKVPRNFVRVTRTGPVHARAVWVSELLEDPERTAVVLVTTPEELPVSETLEAMADVDGHGVPLAGVIANGVFEPLFEPGDAEALARVPAGGDAGAAAAAARARIARTADETEQLARVRPCLAELPFLFVPRLDTAAVAGLGERLAGL